MRLEDLAKQYADRVQFLCVYIKEAHPTDEIPSRNNEKEGILFVQPTTADQRAEIASVCMLRYNFSFPMVLDHMTNEVETKYRAMPERLYVIDAKGVVSWKCGLGPHFFDADGFEAAIAKVAAPVTTT